MLVFLVALTPPCFNSRTPGGVRQLFFKELYCKSAFQFTHPGRGATSWSAKFLIATVFQFTHPGRGATVWCKVPYYGADKQV